MAVRIRRREFLVTLGSAATWPLAARAQQAMAVIGLLGTSTAEAYADRLTAFREGLKQVGYFEGQNVAIEYRWAEGHYDRIPELVADLLHHRVIVIAADGTPQRRGAYQPFVSAYHPGLKEIGYVEGHNVAIEYRWAQGEYARLPKLADDEGK
jgi:hypothetical protein